MEWKYFLVRYYVQVRVTSTCFGIVICFRSSSHPKRWDEEFRNFLIRKCGFHCKIWLLPDFLRRYWYSCFWSYIETTPKKLKNTFEHLLAFDKKFFEWMDFMSRDWLPKCIVYFLQQPLVVMRIENILLWRNKLSVCSNIYLVCFLLYVENNCPGIRPFSLWKPSSWSLGFGVDDLNLDGIIHTIIAVIKQGREQI